MAGANTVQLDEPWLNRLVDPDVRVKDGVSDVAYEIDLCVDMVNQVVQGVDDMTLGLHLCHAHFDHRQGSEGPYDLVMPGLAKIQVDVVSLELATPVSGGVECLRQFPESARLGLGCVDHCDRQVETPELIASRVEAAMEYVDKERIVLHPDCGFSPSVQNPMDLDEAYLKLRAMCSASALLRDRWN